MLEGWLSAQAERRVRIVVPKRGEKRGLLDLVTIEDTLGSPPPGVHGRLDAVVNNAGIVRDRMLTGMTEDDFDLVVDVQNGLPFFTRFATRAPVVVLVLLGQHNNQLIMSFSNNRNGPNGTKEDTSEENKLNDKRPVML